jgi:hypothetical protein
MPNTNGGVGAALSADDSVEADGSGVLGVLEESAVVDKDMRAGARPSRARESIRC